MLTRRQELILNLIVSDYISDAAPIASESLTRIHNLGVSSATIRNEVAILEEQGYITRPHASAGSVPADKAYRLYVESVLADSTNELPSPARIAIRHQLANVEHDMDAWGTVASALLAQLVGYMGFATLPRMKASRVRHIELVPVQEFVALLIVVLEQARLRKHLVRLVNPVESYQMETISQRIRAELIGLNRREIESKPMQLSPVEKDLVEATVLILKDEDMASQSERYVDGLRNLLNQPEFDDQNMMRTIVQGVEDGSLIEAVLAEAPEGAVVEVVIGREHAGDMLRPLSVVICQYGIPGEMSGAIGAVGPTRMEYSKTISGVKFISGVMSGLVEGVYSS
ncbi:MAG: heat-inducible transcription repressor HrcA [Chloroflexi bacterium]|nr:heat-inducible transcription repressor HrcA [Chloroflexota bacterium]MCH8309325.1 heat-inducible transcription repressor HrcA [Chloroflexota bacterium]